MDKPPPPKPPAAKVPFANRPPLAPPPKTTAPAPTPATTKPTATSEAKTAPPVALGSKKAALDKLLAVANNEITWAEAVGMTKHEAFGIAQSAFRLFEHGQQEKGRKAIEALVELNPKVGAFHALLGGMAGRMGDEVTAERCYTKAIELEPGNLAARVNRAEMLLKKGKVADALDDLIAATKIDPKAKSPLGKRAYSLARVTSQGLRDLLARTPKKPTTTTKPR
jgi:predicted Zn-dependent protease